MVDWTPHAKFFTLDLCSEESLSGFVRIPKLVMNFLPVLLLGQVFALWTW